MFGSRKKQVEEKPFVSAIIAAAGTGSRMQMDESKLFLEIAGMPVIARTLQAFEFAASIDEIILVARSEDMIQVMDIIKFFEISKCKQVVTGGEDRMLSVLCGIKAADGMARYFAVHDGARPLIEPEQIDEAVALAYEKKAVAVAVPVKDTIKVANKEGKVEVTPDRKTLFAVQTPQVFQKELYMKAVRNHQSSPTAVTDDCQLVERIRQPVYLCEGSYRNIKITTIEDIFMAEAMLMEEE